MLSKLTAIFLILVTSIAASAVSLQPIPEPKDDPLPITPGQPMIPCDQIMTRLVKYQQMVSAHETSLTSFLSQVTEKLNSWAEQLTPLEGTQTLIAPGTFAPIKDGAEKIGRLSDMAYDNTDLVTGEINLIAASLRTCSVTPLPPALK